MKFEAAMEAPPVSNSPANVKGNPTTFLREDSHGPAVVRLQKQLKKLGFNPGNIDGDFGLATKAAVIAFQKSRGLLAVASRASHIDGFKAE